MFALKVTCSKGLTVSDLRYHYWFLSFTSRLTNKY